MSRPSATGEPPDSEQHKCHFLEVCEQHVVMSEFFDRYLLGLKHAELLLLSIKYMFTIRM